MTISMRQARPRPVFAARMRPALAAMLAAGALTLAPIATSAHTINETLAEAYRHAGLLDKNRAILRAADESVAQAVATLRPVIDYAVSYTYTDGPGALFPGSRTAYRIRSSFTLFDFGNRRLGVEAQKEFVLATRQALTGAEQQVLGAASNAFFDVLEASANVALRQNNVRLITQEKRAAEDRFEVGEVTRTDVALAESRLASARANLAAAQGDLARANAAYEEAVGSPAHTLTQPTSFPPIPDSPATARSIARSTHPDILAAQHAIKVAEIAVDRAQLNTYPTLSGSVTHNFDVDNSFDRDSTLSLEFGGPIYQGGRLDSAIRIERADLDQARADLHIARHAIDEAVAIAYANLAVARASRVASEEQIRAATVAFRGIREEATLGARTTLDVLDAEQELLDARQNRLSAVTSEFKAIYGVLSAIGRLTAKDLGLPVQLYDPAEYYNLVKNAPTTESPQGKALDRVLQRIRND
ncbi:MAG: TolC family outer membrane protein [Pseudomonadota bacterium]